MCSSPILNVNTNFDGIVFLEMMEYHPHKIFSFQRLVSNVLTSFHLWLHFQELWKSGPPYGSRASNIIYTVPSAFAFTFSDNGIFYFESLNLNPYHVKFFCDTKSECFIKYLV